MAQRRHHYERAFERYLRANRLPYIAVDEAKKALLPGRAGAGAHGGGCCRGASGEALKSFDFVVYRRPRNLLLDVKGRRASPTGRMDPWATEEDMRSLEAWGKLFGCGFTPALVFLFWCPVCPAGGLFEEVFEHEGRWYALRAIELDDYRREMRPRSARWGTVCVPARRFEALSRPFERLARPADGNRRPTGSGEHPAPARRAGLACAAQASYGRSS